MSGPQIVLRGGRVIDPESGFDAVADVAIREGRIAQIGAGLPDGAADVDVAGLVVTAYAHSTRPSAGIRHLLVNGTFVVRDGSIVTEARPGRPVRAEPR
jgi:N-acyl-D-aspartate/D-glutamate deacylase